MKRGKGNVTDDDLDLFCRLERALEEDRSGRDSLIREEAERSRLACDFPDCFVDAAGSTPSTEVSAMEVAEYRHMFSEIQSKLGQVNRRQEEVDHAARVLARERAELERERARLERDRAIVASDLASEELLALRKKYRALKQKYKEEKQQLEPEVPHTPPKKAKGKSDAVVLSDTYPLDFTFDPGPVQREEAKSDGRRLVRYRNGLTATVFKNGTRKMKVGKMCYAFYKNGDVAIELEDGTRWYRYAETAAVELNLPDKSTLIAFPDGQREEHLPTGEKTVRYPNGQVKVFRKNGDFELHDPSGRVEKCSGGRIRLEFEERGSAP
jgi:hypothetical protein